MNPNLETRIEREGNVCHISEGGERKYTVVYGLHVLSTNPLHVPQTDGLFLELVTLSAFDPVSRALYFVRALYFYKKSIQYAKIIEKAEQQQIPIYFPDVGLWSQPIKIKSLETPVRSLEYGMGTYTALMTPTIFHYSPILGSASALFSAWVLSRPLMQITGLIAHFTGIGQKVTIPLQKYVHNMHPEFGLLILRIRNKVIAYKKQWLLKQTGASHYTTIIGGGHVQIEDDLQSSLDEKYTFLEKHKQLINDVVIPKTLYCIPELKFSREWELSRVYEIPELKELIAK